MHKSHIDDIGYQVQQISHLVKQLQNERLLKEDLSISHMNVMFVLYEEDRVNQSHIQKNLGIKASSLSKLIDILIQKGLVTRESLDGDARSKIICLTELGKEKQQQLYHVRDELENQLTEDLNETETKQLARMLSQVKNNLLKHS
ncbi:MarR family winged helix-turn-helix transcriptional regulator [Guptibacillus hwajinpoensis]|uniref:MarR family winged helix-turn-helix transcriptional regulator n=1 Tax=Guptibacillus hwajinpoensis TaxID=208199 RepID=UPI00188453EE|nr:MarR family transcriptional regulator [Pseudalkalibacillus hwajinpoensis]MBF0707467.1 MarR family transcriptional regulator [Pseudalkalibacillus hwajinpoensis]WLR58879.1 MarR family transcriptional regulator [Pseudalkalibacillus hwajinpoensis]